MNVVIDALLTADLERCAELESVLFQGDDPWTERAFAAELTAGNFYIAARVDEELVGYAGLAVLTPMPNAEAEVHTIGVDPDYQGKGIGRTLLRTLLAAADAANATTFLEVRTDNEPAIGLYEAHGFETIGLRKRYYQPSGADAYTMRRPPGTELSENDQTSRNARLSTMSEQPGDR